jgi:hypothetical protein
MALSFDLLPVELQASVVELRQAHVSEDAIDTLIARTLQALGVKSNKVQVEVWQMEERLGQQLTQIGDKLQADLQAQHGETNGMLVELRAGVQEAGRGIADIKKQWRELSQWRSRIEASLLGFAEFREESTNDRSQIRHAIQEMDDRHGGQIREIVERLAEIERLLGAAGQHEAGG